MKVQRAVTGEFVATPDDVQKDPSSAASGQVPGQVLAVDVPEWVDW